MSYRGLIIDDDPMIVEVVRDALDSLGHAHDSAECQESARRRLAEGSYDYVLLDLEIPVRKGRFPRIENGINLLEEIRCNDHAPVIVITCNGTNGHEIPVEVMKAGAVDFIAKPFPKTGKTLDKAIRDALSKSRHRAASASAGVSSPPAPFANAEMVFYPNRIELCGIKIISDKGMGHSMAMLEALAATHRGRFVRLSAEQLAAKLQPDNGVNSITSCAATIRDNISTRLLKHRKISCGPNDVLAHDNQGYYLSDRVTVRRSTANVPGDTQHDGPGDIPNDPGVKTNVPGDTPRTPQPAPPLNPRQEWVLSELRSGVKLTRTGLENEHGISSKTAKRDLAELTARGLIQFINRPTPGHYALKR